MALAAKPRSPSFAGAKALPRLGHRVAWHDSATDQGTIIATNWSGVQIEWDNGNTQFFHHNNMTEVSSALSGS